ncbi:hypothetical protein [Endozoicomonas sp. ALB032]|uniref:hypothetical protein n=1 Tax=Endozoicomonas sp. ALB032 TaxID=3403082 RepID=UPI003BB67EB7
MPELAVIETGHFDCVIWSKDIRSSQRRLERTLTERGNAVPTSEVRFSPPLLLKHATEPVFELCLGEAVFFENKYYEIEFLFHQPPEAGDPLPTVQHKLKVIEESFRFSPLAALYGEVSMRATMSVLFSLNWPIPIRDG